MASLTLTPLSPWQAEQTAATLARPASMSAANAKEEASAAARQATLFVFFMGCALPAVSGRRMNIRAHECIPRLRGGTRLQQPERSRVAPGRRMAPWTRDP